MRKRLTRLCHTAFPRAVVFIHVGCKFRLKFFRQSLQPKFAGHRLSLYCRISSIKILVFTKESRRALDAPQGFSRAAQTCAGIEGGQEVMSQKPRRDTFRLPRKPALVASAALPERPNGTPKPLRDLDQVVLFHMQGDPVFRKPFVDSHYPIE